MIKNIDFKKIKIPILDSSSSVIAHLVPISHAQHDLSRVSGQLASWRNANKERFITEFEASSEGTLGWINEKFADPMKQMLFLVSISTLKGKPFMGRHLA